MPDCGHEALRLRDDPLKLVLPLDTMRAASR
jgi:hypothetical protein